MMLSWGFFPIKLFSELNRIFRLSETWNINILKKERGYTPAKYGGIPEMQNKKLPKKTEPPLRRCTCWQRCRCSRCPSSPPPRLSTTSSSSPCPTFYRLLTSAWWESHTPSSLYSFSTTLSSCPSPSSPTSPWWSANHHHHNQPCCRHHSSSSSPLCVIHILAWWLVTSEFERTVNFRKIKFLTSLPHLQCQFNLHARRTNENTFEI